jgi:hypothetical protein
MMYQLLVIKAKQKRYYFKVLLRCCIDMDVWQFVVAQLVMLLGRLVFVLNHSSVKK